MVRRFEKRGDFRRSSTGKLSPNSFLEMLDLQFTTLILRVSLVAVLQELYGWAYLQTYSSFVRVFALQITNFEI